jgi:hypothetical protein
MPRKIRLSQRLHAWLPELQKVLSRGKNLSVREVHICARKPTENSGNRAVFECEAFQL